MRKVEQYLTMADGHEVYVRIYIPNVQMLGHVHILHGMAEHSGRYDRFAYYLCQHGYVVSMHDHRGHGMTAERNGLLGFIAEENGFDFLVNDVLEVMTKVRDGQDWPLPILFGHSMGSFIARRFMQLYSDNVSQVILSGTAATTPLHRMGKYVGKLIAKSTGKKTPSQLLHDMSFGGYNRHFEPVNTAFDWLSSSEADVQKYVDDPYCGFVASAQFFVDLTEGLTRIDKTTELKKIRSNLPVLLISGLEDAVSEHGKGVFKVAEQLNSVGLTDVTVHLFENMRHEILNEKHYEKVFEDILRWLKKHDK